MADRPLRPATRRCLGRPLPHQLADKPRAHPTAQRHFLSPPCGCLRISGINPSFPGLSRSVGQVAHVLLTRSPLRHTRFLRTGYASLDLHALGTPPAFILSQDQTLQRNFNDPIQRTERKAHEGFGLGPGVVRTPSLICSCDCHRTTRRSQAITAGAPLPPLRRSGHRWLVWHIVQLSRSPQLRDLTSCSVSARSAIIPRPLSKNKTA